MSRTRISPNEDCNDFILKPGMGQQYRSRSLILIAKGNCTPGLESDHLNRQAQRKTTGERFSLSGPAPVKGITGGLEER